MSDHDKTDGESEDIQHQVTMIITKPFKNDTPDQKAVDKNDKMLLIKKKNMITMQKFSRN